MAENTPGAFGDACRMLLPALQEQVKNKRC